MQRITTEFLTEVAALDLTTLTACEIDERWEPLTYEEQVARQRAHGARKAADEARQSYLVSRYNEQAAEHEARADRLRDAQDPFLAEWTRRGGWERVFLVLNHDGHYHNDRACSTCFPTTRFGWVPQLSDKTEDEVIAEVGHMACTVCWPAAPRHPKFIAMERAAAEAAQAKADGLCPGSGQRGESLQMQYVSPRGVCPACGRGVSVTKTGMVRQHKTLLQEKIEAQQKDAAKITGDAKAFNRLHTLALKANNHIDLLNQEDPDRAIGRAWLSDTITSQVKDLLKDLLKQRERRAAKAKA